jgi:stage III sporulation protein AG
MNERINEFLKKLRSPKTLIIAGAVGIALILISSLPSSQKQAKESGVFSEQAYCEELEADVKKLVKEITGSSKVSVVITLDGGINYDYADISEKTAVEDIEKEKESSDTRIKEGYITIKNADGGEEALLVNAALPKVRGVAIVCEGGDNEIINQKILNTVTAALDITSKRVYICGRN